jgi:histone H4
MTNHVPAKGIGKGGVRRKRRSFPGHIVSHVLKPEIRRLARRGGVKRMSGMIYEEIRQVLKVFLENVIRDATHYMEYARRKTVYTMDIVHALKVNI